MENEPNGPEDNPVAQTKRRRVSKITRGIATVVYNVRNFFEREKFGLIEIRKNRAIEKTIEATKIFKNVVSRLKNPRSILGFPVNPIYKRN